MAAYASWAIILGGAISAGASLVGLLALARSREPLMVLTGLASLAVTTVGIVRLVEEVGRPDVGIAASLLSLAAAGGGYGLASSLLPIRGRHRSPGPLPECPRDPAGAIAVVLLAPIEAEHYDPAVVADELGDLTDAGLEEPSMAMIPFLFAAQKTRYRAVGGTSPSLRSARALTERLEALLSPDVRFGPVELVTSIGKDALDAAVARLAARGICRIIVATVCVGESFENDRSKSQVDIVRPEAAGVSVVYTAALWGSEVLAERLAERVWSARTEPDHTGVALIMHGQPESRQKTHGVYDVQENAFCNRIRMLLAERGIPEANIRLCYLDWRSPDVTETVRHLAALGCRRVLVVPATLPFESITTLLDLKMAVRQARVQDTVSTVTLQAWGDDDAVCAALRERIEDAAADLT